MSIKLNGMSNERRMRLSCFKGSCIDDIIFLIHFKLYIVFLEMHRPVIELVQLEVEEQKKRQELHALVALPALSNQWCL